MHLALKALEKRPPARRRYAGGQHPPKDSRDDGKHLARGQGVWNAQPLTAPLNPPSRPSPNPNYCRTRASKHLKLNNKGSVCPGFAGVRTPAKRGEMKPFAKGSWLASLEACLVFVKITARENLRKKKKERRRVCVFVEMTAGALYQVKERN